MSVLLIVHLSSCGKFHVCASSFCCDCFIWSLWGSSSKSYPIFSWRPDYNFLFAINLELGHKRLMFLPCARGISGVDFVLPIGSQQSLLLVEISGLVVVAVSFTDASPFFQIFSCQDVSLAYIVCSYHFALHPHMT